MRLLHRPLPETGLGAKCMRTVAPPGYTGNFHEAGFYASDAEFLALIVPFVTSGLAAGEPVVIGYDERKNDLLRAQLPRPEAVAFIADASLYATPAGAIEAYRRQFVHYVTAGAEQIRIAGDVPHEGNGGRFDGWDRYECAVNVVWQDYPVYSRCLYDATTVPDDVRDVVERTHPRLVTADGGAISPRYQEPSRFTGLAPRPDPLVATSPAAQLVGASLKNTVRRVADVARGLIDDAAHGDLMFGLSEAVMNAQQYGRPPVTVKVWADADRIVVHVHDTGPGPSDLLTGLVSACDAAGAGSGLWLTHQLTTIEVALLTGSDGFTVRLRAGRPPGPPDRAVGGARFRAGTARGGPASRTTVHAIDGDGSAMCELLDAADLDPLADLFWTDIPLTRQCLQCRYLLDPSSRTPEH